jgi:rod shape-determining protein MreC
MQLLLDFLFRYRAFLLFFLLEFVCGWLIVRNNTYQSSSLFTSSNQLVAYALQTKSDIDNYFFLRQKNEDLAYQNKKLKEEIDFLLAKTKINYDSTFLPKYDYITAKVINNSLFRNRNYITIDKGTKDGVEIGMGVVNIKGVVGKVKASSDNYATVISLLHSDIQVASRIKKNGVIATTKWDMRDYQEALLLEVGRHVDLRVNDTIVASGYSEVYPENYPLGVVKEVSADKNNSFLDVKIRLFTDFSALNYVYVVKNKKQKEIDSLQTATTIEK